MARPGGAPSHPGERPRPRSAGTRVLGTTVGTERRG